MDSNKILILGADGMVGHKMAQAFSENNFEVLLNSRFHSKLLKKVFPKANIIDFDFLDQNVEILLGKYCPDFIINAAGITIRRNVKKDSDRKKINSILPHRIDSWCDINRKKQILFSTDCVFSGTKGNYRDLDTPNAKDNYGKSKGDGEVNSKNTLTIRSSMIGREIYNKTELLEWLISKENQKIKGFDNCIYTGVTTLWMSHLLIKIIKNFSGLSGIYNVSSTPISKFELIKKIKYFFKINLDMVKDSSFSSNKSLNSNKFFSETNFQKPDWDSMLFDLFLDSENNKTLYDD